MWNLLLLLITIALSSLIHPVNSICMDHDPIYLNKLLIVDCAPKVPKAPKQQNNNNNSFQLNDEKLFQINFNCQITDNNMCNKVEDIFNMAGDIVTYALALNTPIIVNAKFYVMDPKELGGATPTRYISLLDEDDQVERFYPQALVKQLQLTSPVTFSYSESDITAEFNSLINWHFPDDKGSIKKDQYDILYTILHEIIHGLGFISSWRGLGLDTPEKELTPFLVTGSDDTSITSYDIAESPFIFHGFRETIFDKFIIIKDSNGIQTRLSSFANELNQFNTSASQFIDFYDQLQNTPQYEAAKDVLIFSTTKNDFIFMPKGSNSIPDDGIILETKIKPYQAGSSISHVDSIIYNIGNPDFLMRRESILGESLNDLVIKSGNITGSAIGPKLLNILSSIGYNLADNPIKSSATKQSIVDFNLIITLCIIFITLNI
ncbi:hypothetical protein RhiirB3_502604 [Rhizophagus irregularis]|nr:hypothetical protein RhiirB3_502604 [Rhizophagus irregularis]